MKNFPYDKDLFRLGIGILTFSILITSYIAASPSSAQDIQEYAERPSNRSCSPVIFSAGYESSPRSIIKRKDSFIFQSESWIEANICKPGTLSLTAYGQPGGGGWPILTIATNRGVLKNMEISNRKAINIKLERPTAIYLGYFNDYYETDSRIIYLMQISMSGIGCKDLRKHQSGAKSFTEFNQVIRTATFSNPDTLSLIPCRSGKLQMKILGRRGRDQLPVLEIKQNSKILYRQPINNHWQAISLRVDTQPIEMRLVNPYWHVIGDRNLILERISFVPE